VRQSLVTAGFGPLPVVGIVGPQTLAAVRAFQRRRGRTQDGRLLGDTLHALATATGTLPPSTGLGEPAQHRGRAADLSIPCAGTPTMLDRFAFGGATPTAAHRTALASLARTIVASWATDRPVHTVCIDGHADSVGSLAANEALGQRRAEAIRAELIAAIDREDPSVARRIAFWATTSGETKPVAPNTDDEHRARNRRVEVRLGQAWRGGTQEPGVSIAAVEASGEATEDLAEADKSFDVLLCATKRLRATARNRPGGTPAYTWTVAHPWIARLQQTGGTQAHPNLVDVRGVSPGSTTVTVTHKPASGATATATATIVVQAPAVRAMPRYGCHDLRKGDKDRDSADGNRPRWGGVARAAATVCLPAPASPPADPRHVRDLQEDLRRLGFLVVGAPSGEFDRATEWAVREFQIYAKMPRVARVRAGVDASLRRGAHLVAADLGFDEPTGLSAYVASLEAVDNDACYGGSVSGVVNAATRACIDRWLQNEWRCPVIVEAWSMRRGARHRPVAINLWAHDAHASASPRMFARDFTGYYTMPTGHAADDMHVIGDFVTYLTWSGPRSLPPQHTWTDAELLPAALTGTASPTGAARTTYRVVRAVSEVECIGFFDSVNCYDNAFVSVGPCHWTLGIVDAAGGSVSRGELCGYLAYLRHADRAAFFAAFEFFGARIDRDWTSAAGANDGADLFDAGSRKYTGWVAQQQENGTFLRAPLNEADGNYFKTWHWHYRFVMAGRTIEGYRRRMWDMARVRLRDILAVPWGAGVANVGTRPATIGDVFTSERAVAMLLRWHIRFPGHVVSGGAPGTRLRNALRDAKAAGASLTWTGDPSRWTDAHETLLVDGIMSASPANVHDTLEYVRDWPTWVGGSNPRGFTLAAPMASRLSAARASFTLDGTGLPPAPP
jgi:peptidoglycan hydrolase-like protein with peptidoglycan-binding domain